MAGVPQSRRSLGQPALACSTQIVNGPLEFGRLAQNIL
jgi:hypothetical protein